MNDTPAIAAPPPLVPAQPVGTPETDAAAFDTGLRMEGEAFSEDLHVVVSIVVARSLERQRDALRTDLSAALARIRELEGLLSVARCPNCDGSGVIRINEWEVEQCQWCDEQRVALSGSAKP